MLEVVAVPAFTDNYIWLLHEGASGETAVVDPGDAAPALAEVKRRGHPPPDLAAASVDACQDELLVARLGEVDAVAGAIEPRVIGIVAHLSRLVRRPGDRDDEQPGALCIRETPDAVGTRASKDEPPAVRRERGPRVMTGRAHDVARLGTVRAHDANAAFVGVRPGGIRDPGAVPRKRGRISAAVERANS